MSRKRKSSVGEFQAAATVRGFTYAQAQMEETIKSIGRVRAPAGYTKVGNRRKNLITRTVSRNGEN